METERGQDRQTDEDRERTGHTDRWRYRENNYIDMHMETERELDRLREIRRQTENLTDRHMETKRELEITDR